MEIEYAVWMYNRVPKSNGIAPMDLLTKTTAQRHVLQNAHLFGCPVYVLDPNLQNGSKIPKFQPSSRRGMFMGFRPRHSSTVPLEFNIQTLSITTQYHVMFDDWSHL
jgi:hypothetical protein